MYLNNIIYRYANSTGTCMTTTGSNSRVRVHVSCLYQYDITQNNANSKNKWDEYTGYGLVETADAYQCLVEKCPL
jgi:hypothetical protein